MQPLWTILTRVWGGIPRVLRHTSQYKPLFVLVKHVVDAAPYGLCMACNLRSHTHADLPSTHQVHSRRSP